MESIQTEQSTQEEKSSGPSNTRTWVILVACLFELVFFGGSIFGWASLAFVLKADGLFSLSCPDPITTSNDSSNITSGHLGGVNRTQYIECVSQEESLSLVFTVGIAFFGLTSFPVGWIFDKFGLKLTRLFAAMTGCCGYLLVAFADKDVSWFLFPGMACVATSCITMILTNSYIGRMAGKKSSTIITLYAGSISSSVVVFLVVKLLHDVGISRKLVLSVLAALWAPSLLITFFLLPSQKTSFCCPTPNKVSPNNNQPKSTDSTVDKAHGVDHKEQSKSGGIETGTDKKSSTLSENLIIRYLLGNRVVPGAVSDMLSLMYLMYIYWYCVLHVRIQFFISQFNVWVGSLVDHDIAQVSHFTNVLGYAMMFSIVISPLGGILIDSRRSLLKDMVPGQGARSIVALPCLIVTAVSSMMLCVLIYCKQPYLIYVTIIFTEIYRSFFYATGLALLELSFPKEHYGRLFGLARSISGVMSFLQYPYVLFANNINHGIIIVNLFLLVTVLLSVMLPLYIVLLYVRHKRQVAAQGDNHTQDVRF